MLIISYVKIASLACLAGYFKTVHTLNCDVSLFRDKCEVKSFHFNRSKAILLLVEAILSVEAILLLVQANL